MEIIPVIDIMGGKVVRGSGGDRSRYPLLQSIITNSCEPQQVISDLLDWHPFITIYIADLDAIENGINNHEMYSFLERSFPKVEFWIDAGIRTQASYEKFNNYTSITPVIGSETLKDGECLLQNGVSHKSILSLDFKQGVFLGQSQLLRYEELWTNRVIVMELDSVGEQSGPNINHLIELKQKTLNSQLIAAGGIRGKQDLIRLAEQGIMHALVASALHNGALTRSELVELSIEKY